MIARMTEQPAPDDPSSPDDPTAPVPEVRAAVDPEPEPEAVVTVDVVPGPMPPSVRAALEMGISDLDDIRDLITTAQGEELRADLLKSYGMLRRNAQSLLAAGSELERRAERYVAQQEELADANFELDVKHVALQKVLMSRIEALAGAADVNDLYTLVSAYAFFLPYWPWHREEAGGHNDESAT